MIRQPRKSYAQAASKGAREGEKKTSQREENTPEVSPGLADLKDSLEALRDVRFLIQEFPTIIEAAKRCKQAKSRSCLTPFYATTTFTCQPELQVPPRK
ncbi:hypothetical protein AVEN_199585-1 [Araneus ventricosus]|uniref:Uncharacterized protein n=1 Tax=Araneus ventricosus TaxID=182803 RepID=A0A4Y2J004_ARAVE|nr:hypothetical protein AVEN_199585-1 [Araneus ventricosus]